MAIKSEKPIKFQNFLKRNSYDLRVFHSMFKTSPIADHWLRERLSLFIVYHYLIFDGIGAKLSRLQICLIVVLITEREAESGLYLFNFFGLNDNSLFLNKKINNMAEYFFKSVVAGGFTGISIDSYDFFLAIQGEW